MGGIDQFFTMSDRPDRATDTDGVLRCWGVPRDDTMNGPTTNRPDDQALQVMAHGCAADADHDREVPEIDLLQLTDPGRAA